MLSSFMQKENVIKILNLSNTSLLEPPSYSNQQTTEMRFSVGTTCQLKMLLETLVSSKAAITGDPGQEDVEQSATLVVFRKLYLHSCYWVCEMKADHMHATVKILGSI